MILIFSTNFLILIYFIIFLDYNRYISLTFTKIMLMNNLTITNIFEFYKTFLEFSKTHNIEGSLKYICLIPKNLNFIMLT